MSLRHFLRALLPALALPVAALAASLQNIEMRPGFPVGVAVSCFHDSVPPQGFMPVRVTLTNDSDRAMEYTFAYARADAFDSVKVAGEFSLRVGPGSRTSSILYVPVLASGSHHGMRGSLRGPGVKDGEFLLYSHYGYGGRSQVYTGMGEAFSVRHLGAIEAEAKKASSFSGQFPATKISSAYAPADRRAYDAFSTLWFDMSDWSSLEPATQSAIREWVLLGGRLHLVSPSGRESVEPLGLGAISRVTVGADDAAFSVRAARMMYDVKTPVMRTVEGQPKLFAAFKSAAVDRPVALILLLIGFGLVVGPVNLFVFAKPPRRHRLLWTTPLIALVAAALLLVAILISDGTGGTGRRFALAVLDPQSKRIALWQQQISRTGLLLGDAFAFEPSASLVPTFESTGGGNERQAYEKTGDGWRGDWFTSRKILGQSVFDTVAARGGLRVKSDAAGNPVSVESSLEFPLSRVVVVSRDGSAAYEAEGLVPGVSRPLKAADIAMVVGRWTRAVSGAGDALSQSAAMVSSKDGHFYAELAKPESLLRPTLRSIEWRDDVVLLTGPAEFLGADTK